MAEARRNDLLKRPSVDAPLTDEAGHISLFPEEATGKKQKRDRYFDKDSEVETEAAKKKREFEDQYTMRFSNAAGFKQNLEMPWYSSASQEITTQFDVPNKDVWGNEDLGRREREKQRMDANDPLAAMKKGVRQLRGVEEERRRWCEERKNELEALKEADKNHESRRHRRRSPKSRDSLDGFSLDANSGDYDRHRAKRHSRHSHHRDRDGSRRKRHRGSRDSPDELLHRKPGRTARGS